MAVSRHRIAAAALATIAAMGVNALLSKSAQAATTYYFDVNGSTAGFGIAASGSYDWDATSPGGGLWTTSSTGATSTVGWPASQFPRFAPASNLTYAVNVTNDEKIAGMYASTAQNLTINASGSGALDVVGGIQGFIGGGTPSVHINAPIVSSDGLGGINPNTGGNWYLNASNSYQGGTSLTSTSTLIYFSNNHSFGTNTITNNVASATGFAPLLAQGGTTITIPNNFAQGGSALSGAGINFAADPSTPVVSTGTWALGALNLGLRNNGGNAASTLALTNTISGTAGITLSSNTSGIIIFGGANLYSGTTTITGPGGTGTGTTLVTLRLGASNTIASSSQVILDGGILDPDGLTQSMMSTTLAVLTSTSPSTLTYASGNTEVDFANSSAVTWTGTLNLTNWTTGFSLLRFGTDHTGLTSTQLADIEFNSDPSTKGEAVLTSTGYVVPEPATAALVLLGAPVLIGRRRRAR